MNDPLDLNNVLEVKSIIAKCTTNEKETLKWILKCANNRINDRGLDKEMPFLLEPNLEPLLSDHSSDEEEEIVLIEDSESE